ncbi:MAG: hypothetical protein U0U69_03065 [Acidimicrobiia bacterium]
MHGSQHGGAELPVLIWDSMWARRGNERIEGFTDTLVPGDILVVNGSPAGLFHDVATGTVGHHRGRLLLRGCDIPGDLGRRPDVAGVVGGAPRLYGPTAAESVLTHLGLAGVRRHAAVQAARRVLRSFGLEPLASVPLHRLDNETLWVLDLARATAPQPDLLLVNDPWRHFGADRSLRETFLLGLTFAAVHPRRPAGVVLCTKDPSAADRLRDMPGGSRTRAVMLSYHGRTMGSDGRFDADAG